MGHFGSRDLVVGAARFVVRKLEERGHAVTLVDSQEHQLPFLDMMYKEYEAGKAPEAMKTVGRCRRHAN